MSFSSLVSALAKDDFYLTFIVTVNVFTKTKAHGYLTPIIARLFWLVV